jgi:hypothetical protein
MEKRFIELHLSNMDREDNFCLSNAQQLPGYSWKDPLAISHIFSSLAGLSGPSDIYAYQSH